VRAHAATLDDEHRAALPALAEHALGTGPATGDFPGRGGGARDGTPPPRDRGVRGSGHVDNNLRRHVAFARDYVAARGRSTPSFARVGADVDRASTSWSTGCRRGVDDYAARWLASVY
jgi:hypothetical protein